MDILLEKLIIGITFLVMIVVGLDLNLSNLTQLRKSPLQLAIGVVAQLSLLPLLSLGLILLLELPLELAIGMLLVSLCPGGAVSNYYTMLARGDIAYSVAVTTLTSLLCFVSLPTLFNYFSPLVLDSTYDIKLPVQETLQHLFTLLILPVLLGAIVRHFFNEGVLRYLTKIKLLSALGLFAVVALIFIDKGQFLIDYIGVISLAVIVFTLSALVLGFAVSYLFRLNYQQQIALTVEFPSRNLAIATVVGLTMLELENSVLFAASMFVLQLPVFMALIWANIKFGGNRGY